MIERRANVEKQLPLTPINPGPVPDDWQIQTIGAVSHRVTNGFVGSSLPHQVEDGVTYLQGFNIRPSRIELKNRTFVSQKFHLSNYKSQLKAGDVLVVQSGHIGTAARIPDNFGEANCHALIIVDLDRERVIPDYLVEHLNSSIGQARMRGLHVGSSMLHINTSELAEYRLPLPPILEQCKIAEILRTWDDAIEKLEALRSLRARRLQAFRDELLFGAKRKARRRTDRPICRLGDVTRELTARNSDMVLGRELVMGVTNSRGIVPMREQTVADDISRYKLLPSRAFAYNPMRINVGSIAMNEDQRTVLVSPDYVVFACNAGGIEADYLDHLRQTRWWLHHVNSGGTGSVRQRTYYDDLAALHLPLPEPNEQAAIIAVLNAAKAEIATTERMLDVIARQKHGLMQKLLTGEWRVKVEAN